MREQSWTGQPLKVNYERLKGSMRRFDLDVYRGGKDLDIYRGNFPSKEGGEREVFKNVFSEASMAMVEAKPQDKSYLFCPTSHGMMSPGMVSNAAKALPVSTLPSEILSEKGEKSLVKIEEGLKGREIEGKNEYETGNMQFLTILVPSSSLDWGRMSNAMNATNDDDGESWFEIGCMILNTRIVQEVSFDI